MRRGAPLNSYAKKPAVMADVDDLEGGSGYGGGSAPSSGSHLGLAAPSSGGGGSSGLYPMPYDSGKSTKRRSYRHGYQSLLTGATSGMSDAMLQKCVGVLAAAIIVGAVILPLRMRILWLVYGAVVFGAAVSMWLSKNVLSCDDGTQEMRAVVRDVCDGFLLHLY